MNEPLSQIEQELAALQPAHVSSELERRIGERIAESNDHVSLPSKPSSKRLAGLAVGAIAASIVVTSALWRVTDNGSGEAPIVKQNEATPRIESQPDRPTLLALHRALATSDESFEKLLDEHARGGSAAATGMDVPTAFARGASHEFLNLGEL
jgi:hypothetical protein